MAIKPNLLANQHCDFSAVGTLSHPMTLAGDIARRQWNNTTADASAPARYADEGTEVWPDKAITVETEVIGGGTDATFALYWRSGLTGMWRLLTAYGTGGSYTQAASNDPHGESVSLPPGCDRVKIQATAKSGSPTTVAGYIAIGN